MKLAIQKVLRERTLLLGVLTSGLSLLVLLGVDISADQMAGIGVFLGALIGLLRFVVTPAEEVVAQLPPGEPTPVAGPASFVADGKPVAVIPQTDL